MQKDKNTLFWIIDDQNSSNGGEIAKLFKTIISKLDLGSKELYNLDFITRNMESIVDFL